MSKSIQTQIIRVDKSQGIRIPKSLLDRIGSGAAVEIEVRSDRIVIRTAAKSRTGWEEAFAKMAEQHDDVLLDEIASTEWEENEWQW